MRSSSSSRRLLLFALAVCHFLAATSLVAQEAPEHRRHVYSAPGGHELEALVVEPEGSRRTGRPAVVIVHGGGWAIGEASWGLGRAGTFSDLGLVAISIQYRLSTPETGFTPLDAMADTRAAIRWVRAHATELGIDPNRIAGYGWSAGAHLLAAAAIFEGAAEKDAIDCTPNLLLLASPAVSLADSSWVRQILAARAEPIDISPDEHVRPGMPPTLIVQGRTDTVTPLAGTQRFHDAMLAAGNSSELIVYDGVGHLFTPSTEPDDGWPNPDPTVSAAATGEMSRFLSAHGYVDQPPD